MMGGISNMEYGWSDAIVNRAPTTADTRAAGVISPRPSTQMSIRSSLDYPSGRPKLPGDRITISEWTPPQQSMFASQLLEIDQLRALQQYVTNVEAELQKHNDLRGAMMISFSHSKTGLSSGGSTNGAKAMGNWEKKSSYLLREIVKFRTYIDTLQNAGQQKERINRQKEVEERERREEREGRERSEVAGAMIGVM
jgi:hypothetical protein